MTVIIECISWLIKVTDINDARWKPEVNSHVLFDFIKFWVQCPSKKL